MRQQEDLLFFLLQVKRKQSGKWSVRAVSRRGAPSAPRLPPSRLTRAQRAGSRRPPAPSAARGPVSARLWPHLGRWGTGPGPRAAGSLAEPWGQLAGVSPRAQPARPVPGRIPVSSEPGQGRHPGGPLGPELGARSRPPRGAQTAPRACAERLAESGSSPARRQGPRCAPGGGAASRAPSEEPEIGSAAGCRLRPH